jgi:large subunit ribosomal protein L10
LLAQFAGALSAPMQQLAGLIQALPRNLAYGLAALVDQRGGPPAADGDSETPETAGDAATDGAAGTEAATEAGATIEAGDEPAAGGDSGGSADAPSGEAPAAETPAAETPAVDVGEAGTEPATSEAGEQ